MLAILRMPPVTFKDYKYMILNVTSCHTVHYLHFNFVYFRQRKVEAAPKLHQNQVTVVNLKKKIKVIYALI